jgi:PAS domain S-box
VSTTGRAEFGSQADAQFRAVFEALQEAALITDDERRYVAVNPAACRLLGLSQESILGRRVEEFSPPGTSEAVLRQWEEFIAAGRQSGDFIMTRPNGELRHVRFTATANIVPGRHLSILRDVTAAKLRETAYRESQEREELSRQATEAALEMHRGVEEQLTLIVEASGALLSSLETEDVLGRILSLSARFLAADAYAIWRRGVDGAWSMVRSRGLSDRYRERRASGLNTKIEIPSTPMVVHDVLAEPRLASGSEEMVREGIRSMLVIPMRIHGEISGTLLFYFRAPHLFPSSEVRIASALANLSASAITLAELYEEQKSRRLESVNAQRRSSFLAEASDLLASSLDFQTTLGSVARLAVPHIADWCAVDIRESSGERRRLAVAHMDDSKAQLAFELDRKYPDLPSDPIPTVMRTGEPQIVPVSAMP